MDYFEVEAFSASAIKAGAVSMLAMHDYIVNGKDKTSSMRTGSIRHTAVLEPEKFAGIVAIEYDGRTKEGKEIIAKYGKDNIMKPAEKEAAQKAADMVMSHPAVVEHRLFHGGVAEHERYWESDGIQGKCKVDYDHESYFIEYKTCNNLKRFNVAAAGMFYHLQLGWYWHGCGRKKCYIVAQEQKAPYDVAVFEVPQLSLAQWYAEAMEIVKRYVSGDRSGAFPELMTFELPAWAMDLQNVELDPESLVEF